MKIGETSKSWQWWLSLGSCMAMAIYVLGPYIINPFQVKELLQGDVCIHYLGWAFFRYADWTLPLGEIPDYYYPIGSNIGFTDSIPLMAILFKPLSPFLPTDFQYIGIWLLLCVGLQARMSWGLLGTLGIDNKINRAIGTILLTSTPVWFFRLAHPALCAHWLILACFWIYAIPPKEKVNSLLKWQYVLVGIVSFVHPYLAVMILALAVVWVMRLGILDSVLTWWKVLLHMVGFAGLMVGAWWLTGYFSISEAGRASTGLTTFSTNLNGFFNPLEDTSQFLNSLPLSNPLQYEGYAYLGIGGLFLVLAAVVSWVVFRFRGDVTQNRTIKWWPLWLTAFLMFVWALSIQVYFGSTRVLRYDIADALIPTLSAFRTTGRFVWTLYYLLLLSAFVFVVKKWPDKWWVTIVLGIVLNFQIIDQQPLWKARAWFKWTSPESFLYLSPEKWEPVIAESDAINIWPPFEMTHIRDAFDYAEIGYLAARNQKPAMIGFVARAEKDAADHVRRAFEKDLKEGKIDSSSLFLFLKPMTPYFEQTFKQLDLVNLDGYLAGVHKSAPAALKASWEEMKEKYHPPIPRGQSFGDYLRKHEAHTILIASLDEATYRLNEGSKAYLDSLGSDIRQLGFRGAYAAVLEKGELVWEEITDGQKIELNLSAGKTLNGRTFGKDLRMVSSGINAAYEVTLNWGGKEYAEEKRGMNILVISAEGEVIDATNFDTFETSYRWLEDEKD
ncbi:MAG: DUF6311 domain-containing protein [Bacteroidota bacterium]